MANARLAALSALQLLRGFAAVAVGPRLPNMQGCVEEVAKRLPYCDTSLSIDVRLDDLLARFSLEEKVAQITPQGSLGNVCITYTRGKADIGLPPWVWLVETNTNVASGCPQQDHCATTFVGPLGMAASFNRSSWRYKGLVLASEMRALRNSGASRFTPGSSALIGLTAFGPNINIARDPRFGRNSELPGEDPLLSGTYAYEMVSGLQERDSAGRPKVAAFLKHFAAYSTESIRGHDTYNISLHDLFDTYLPQFERAFDAHPAGVMCSYAGINGAPSCSNNWLLNRVLRSWDADAIVTTDCGAVGNLRGFPVNAPDDIRAAAFALMNGTDLEMGDDLFRLLPQAIRAGFATEARLDEAVRRTFRIQFLLGRFDPVEASEWNRLNISRNVNNSVHQGISYDAALQSLVLLKNDRALPLRMGQRLAVLGPLATAREGLLSDYASDQICFGGGFSCIETIAEAMLAANIGGATVVHSGVDVNTNATDGIEPALALAAAADAIVLVMGIDRDIEHEGVDRSDTALPGRQEEFAMRVLGLDKPTVLVLINGGALAIDGLVAREGDVPYAIVEAFNPATAGARAIAASLFGEQNRWGKLPVTLYPHSFIYEKEMGDYDVSSGVGRTYRYYRGTPLFPFGHGLSLTEFSLSCATVQTGERRYRCEVRNIGTRAGDEVIQVYHSPVNIGHVDHPVPSRTLIDFVRVSIRAGDATSVEFTVSDKMLLLVNAAGTRTLYAGLHRVVFSRGHGEEPQFDVRVSSQEVVV